ncbi:MAG TPA: hypothetical protein PKY50_20070 [Candidatus Competibacter sp.]|nr:hypothetical protein [Candidatus Competibacter sp.]
MNDIVFSWPHVLSFLLGAAVGGVLLVAGRRPRAETPNARTDGRIQHQTYLINLLMDHAAFWLYPGRRVWIGVLILGLPWLLYGLNLAFGAGEDFDLSGAYGGVSAGAGLLVLLAWATRRFLPIGVQRSAHRARLRSLEREFEHEIARLRRDLEHAERGLEATRRQLAGSQEQKECV